MSKIMGQRRNKGQALVMVTLALLMLFGMLGLAVDLGWSFFVQRAAQNAADAAALAAAHEALLRNGPGYFSCDPGRVDCNPTPTPCSTIGSPSNLEFACQYAQQNGFADGGKNGRQEVTVAADTSSPPPTLAGDPRRQVQVYYWVTVRVRERVPQLFSAVLGHSTGYVSARATAAVADTIVTGSLILINRSNDPSPEPGENLVGHGGPTVTADGPILLASTADGPGNNDPYAGNFAAGGGDVTAPRTLIRGSYDIGSGAWIEEPQTYQPDSRWFRDPFEGKGQPPGPDPETFKASNSSLVHAIPFGLLQGGDTPETAPNLEPGFYYAVGCPKGGNCDDGVMVPTGEPLHVSGYINFTKGGMNFGEYVFFGGLDIKQPETHARFDPGRYIFAGALDGEKLLEIRNKVVVEDNSPPLNQPNDAGELFIFTDACVEGLCNSGDRAANPFLTADQVPDQLRNSETQVLQQLGFGEVQILAGQDDSLVALHGLNLDAGAVPEELKDFRSVAFWQDQRDSSVKYTSDGYVDESCAAPGDAETACYYDGEESGNKYDMSHRIWLQAGSNYQMWGVIYQPRGAWVHIQAADDYAGPIQVVSGGLDIGGTADVRLRGLDNPITIKTVALVE